MTKAMDLSFDREKYLQIARTQGINAALTQLHHDTAAWELEAFEGRDGWKPEMWKKIAQVRDFSRELWEMALKTEPVSP